MPVGLLGFARNTILVFFDTFFKISLFDTLKFFSLENTTFAPTTAFGSGENINNPMAMYLSDLLTIPANLAGLPAISLPCGFDKSGLPIGLQLIGNVFEEAKLLQVANQFENAAEIYKNRPKTDFTL